MIEIYGHSDDVVCVQETRQPIELGTRWADEVGPNQMICVGSRESGGVLVTMFYAPSKKAGPTWAARIQQVDEGVFIPWAVSVIDAPPGGLPDPQSYSVMVRIDCPPGTAVHVGKRKLSP